MYLSGLAIQIPKELYKSRKESFFSKSCKSFMNEKLQKINNSYIKSIKYLYS